MRRFFKESFPPAFKVRTFDRIFSVEALYYYADLQQAIEAVFAHLAPGGRFVTVIDHYEENPRVTLVRDGRGAFGALVHV